jgi:hypothetical protein
VRAEYFARGGRFSFALWEVGRFDRSSTNNNINMFYISQSAIFEAVVFLPQLKFQALNNIPVFHNCAEAQHNWGILGMMSARIRRIIRIIRKRLAAWYEGEFIPHQNDPGSRLVRVGGTHERSLAARALRCLIKFWEAHWQWSIGVGVAILALHYH